MKVRVAIISLFICGAVAGQYKGPKFPIKDDWFWKFGAKGLQVGDKIPDIPLGTVINNKTGKTRFSQFKGKLVILDFFSSGCSSCFEGFPEMEKLQKEFEGKIQIILVDPWETENRIREEIGKRNPKLYKLPDLPRIVSSRAYVNATIFDGDPPVIWKLFPMRGNPHHVWIDGEGIIRLRGSNYNSYAEKIRDFLSGRPIQGLNDINTVPRLTGEHIYQQLGYMRETPVSYGSFITPFSNEVNGTFSDTRVVLDTVNGVRITSYINKCLLELYHRCFGNDKYSKRAKDALFCPGIFDFLKLPPGTDSLLYFSNSWEVNRPLTTEELIRSRYCYEQVVPLAVSEEERKQMMLDDLNRYFKIHYGITGAIENQRVAFYELVRTSAQDKITIKPSEFVFHAEVIKRDGQFVLDYKGPVSELFRTWLKNEQVKISEGLLYDSTGRPLLIYNGTGWDRKQLVSMQIPLKDLQTVIDLRLLLQGYGLDLVDRYEELPFVVFKRIDEKTNVR